jgi:hypothetical protein
MASVISISGAPASLDSDEAALSTFRAMVRQLDNCPKFPTQGNREFFPPEQGIFRQNRELTGNLRKHRRQARNGAKNYRRRPGQFDRNPLWISAERTREGIFPILH